MGILDMFKVLEKRKKELQEGKDSTRGGLMNESQKRQLEELEKDKKKK